MAFTNIINQSIAIIKLYCPNLLEFISEKEFGEFIRKSINHTSQNGGGTTNNNFLVTFFRLVGEHSTNESEITRTEFKYFNYVLGKFLKLGKNKAFKDLLIGVIFNFEQSSFKNILGEIGAGLTLSTIFKLNKYEKSLSNGKSVDFEFIDNSNNIILVEVLNIEFDSKRYHNPQLFQKFICGRLQQKFNDKTLNLDDTEKAKLYIFPVLHGFTIEIIRENADFLNNLYKREFKEIGFNSCMPRVFINIQGTYFDFFTTKQISNHELQ
ncbi:hypothetical protein [Flavobacterium sp.]|uniref:hypothetical protein n=1 Tax=Flavobacterium sp. TaxID=239 RepID=UPI003D6A44E8